MPIQKSEVFYYLLLEKANISKFLKIFENISNNY